MQHGQFAQHTAQDAQQLAMIGAAQAEVLTLTVAIEQCASATLP